MKVYRRFAPDRPVVLHRGDCIEFLRELPDNSVDLTITSPPYCMGKEYERKARLDDFVRAHMKLLPEIVRVTKTGGSVCWQIGYYVSNSTVTPLDFIVHSMFEQWPDMRLRNRLIWTYGHGLHCAARFSGRHEMVLWYTKGEVYRFHLDRVRVPQKYPGKRFYKGDRKGQFSSNPLGKNPSDVWEIPNVKANHVEKTIHPCQFPVALATRFIRALTDPGDTVLDPFIGSGSTAAAAVLENRKILGAEIRARYYRIAVQRCRDAYDGKLRYRDLDKPIYIPDPRTEVARNPFVPNGKEPNGEKKIDLPKSGPKNGSVSVPDRKARRAYAGRVLGLSAHALGPR